MLKTTTMREVAETEVSPGLKLALEMGPVAMFVLVYSQGERLINLFALPELLQRPIFLATAVFMAAMVVSLAVSWVLTRSLPVMPVVTLIVVLIFGGLTLYFQNDTFIKMKPTIVNTLFGATLLGGLLFGKALLKVVMGPAFAIDDEGWFKLSLRWGLFFLFLAVVNEIVWRNFSESFWVGFKFWGMTGLTFLFVASQMPMIMRHSLEQDAN